MSEWDIDRSGTVNVLELSAAAKAHKKVKEEGAARDLQWREIEGDIKPRSFGFEMKQCLGDVTTSL